MRSKSEPNGKGRTSFIEEARRTQIIDTAIEIIADRGLSAASLAEIARGAGCSKGVISYHFEGKEELIEAILSRLIREPADFIKTQVDDAETALDKVAAYVSANFEFMLAHRNHYAALVDLWGSRGWYEGRNRFNAEAYEPSRAYLSRILEVGHETGELRGLPAASMGSVIQGAIDGVMLQWIYDPTAIDLDACRHEILQMITTHVARGPADAMPAGEEPGTTR